MVTKIASIGMPRSVRATHSNGKLGPSTSTARQADTLLILHAISASKLRAIVHIASPDTDVFVLALQKLHLIGNNVSILVGTGCKRRLVKLQPIH